jgi:hypothetical protein
MTEFQQKPGTPKPGSLGMRGKFSVRYHPMRFLILSVLTLVWTLPAIADQLQFSKFVKASLVFRDDFDATSRYPHILKVFLRLDNTHDSDVSWVANSKIGIEAELLDADGNPVQEGPSIGSVQSNSYAYLLPYGSRLDWLISHGGISMIGDAKDKYALMVGCRGWLIPIATAGTYSLRIRLRGLPWTRTSERNDPRQSKLLLDLPPTKLEVIK